MKHVVLVLAAAILIAFAGVVIIPNRHALTVVHLGFGGGCILLAFALAIPADFKNACAAVAPYIPMIRGGSSSGGPS